ncbi:hypothetical protein [Sphingobacterium endophyticum]|uniref:hypothetical protein n=1 Tax=Sphingobacterium endophyticum TaxID=2546448 RepID=UPI0012E24556|nr:hypothetical protein [Sphingobacterium endophyticum]
MMTSWNETKRIDDYLLGKLPVNEALLFDVQLLIDEELEANVKSQQRSYEIIRQFGRAQLRNELEAVQQKLFTDPKYTSFKQKIVQLFKKP